jgi:SHS family lactate transporter-like MFS transporter
VTTDTAAIRWWGELSKNQWIAARFDWMLDVFDFTIFVLIAVPIAKEFNPPRGRGASSPRVDI